MMKTKPSREAINIGYNFAIERDPGNAFYYERRADAYEILGNSELAKKDRELARQYRIGDAV